MSAKTTRSPCSWTLPPPWAPPRSASTARGAFGHLSTEYRGEWLRELLLAVKSKVLVVDRGAVAEILALKDLPFEHVVVNGGPADEGLPGATMHELESFTSYEPFRGTIDRHHGDTNSILWTSGTTGPSKGSCNRTRCGCSGRSVTTRCTGGGVREGRSSTIRCRCTTPAAGACAYPRATDRHDRLPGQALLGQRVLEQAPALRR